MTPKSAGAAFIVTGPRLRTPPTRSHRCAILAVAGLVLAGISTPASAEPGKISIELNKLEPQDKSCRAFFVIGNDNANEYESLRLDIVLFQPDGVIGRRMAVNFAPLKASKKVVKQFDLEGLGCDQIGSILINEVLECKVTGGAVADCLAGLTVSSLTKVQLSK